jgi:hypothetical protein
MQELDAILDDQPHHALDMVESDILNKKAHDELRAYNDHKHFLYNHPLTLARQYYTQQFSHLYTLKTTSPDLFLHEITNITQNIRRIESAIRNKKYRDSTELLSWQDNLRNAHTKKTILLDLISK